MKFEFDELINGMLDKIPNEIWESSTTTFADPAMGGGQIVRAIEQRLRKYGHSDENIKGRVYGFEDSVLKVHYAVNKHKLVGSYNVSSYDEFLTFIECNLKNVDVIVGNPPYNSGKRSGASGYGNSAWEKFLPKLWPHLKADGYVCFVHPPGWRTNRYSKPKRAAANIMFENQLHWVRAAFPFPGGGCHVDAFVLQKRPSDSPTLWENADGTTYRFHIERDAPRLVNRQNEMIQAIMSKLFTADNSLTVFPRKMSMTGPKLDRSVSGQFEFVSGARMKKTIHSHPHIHQARLKVILSDNRAFRPYIDEGKLGIGDHVHYAIFDKLSEAQWFVNFVNSRLSRFLQWIFCEDYNATVGCHGSEPWNSMIPFLMTPFGHGAILNDEDLYQHFGLTPEEIAYVESTVK